MHARCLELFNADTESVPFVLARLGQSDGAFVSCYLDTRAGQQASSGFLNRTAAQIRGTLSGIDRFYFDTAVEMVSRGMTENWRTETQGMALFARGISGIRQLTVIHSATPLDNRLIRYSVPEVLPLIALHQREPAFQILLFDKYKLRLFESKLGSEVTEVCVEDTEAIETIDLVTDATPVGADSGRSAALPNPGWHLHKALGTSSLPLFVAGTKKALSSAAGWLPRRATERLVGSLQVSPDPAIEDLLLDARMRLGIICREESTRLADAVTDHCGQEVYARLGYRATLEALQGVNAEAVIIADWDSPGGLGLPLESRIEICLAALRQGVRVVLADSVRLREAGGVACLLRHPDIKSESQHGDRGGAELERVA